MGTSPYEAMIGKVSSSVFVSLAKRAITCNSHACTAHTRRYHAFPLFVYAYAYVLVWPEVYVGLLSADGD